MVELDNNKAPLFGRRDAYYDRARDLLESGDLDAIFARMGENPVNIIYYFKYCVRSSSSNTYITCVGNTNSFGIISTN